ncbi:stage 0 sporulation family protein [Barrientosiimonas marina]|uniref:Stage 0 sporulation family protein n=1 Tax=Lentibacillus kimchii TaxID=1542911 RepID=A0ABW2UVD3_9BACI
MIEVAGVRFKQVGKIYYFDPDSYPLEENDYVIVETARGVEFGKVVITNRMVEEDDVVLPLNRVIRKASEEDKMTVAENNELADRALKISPQKVRDHDLDMKLVDADYTFDRQKIIFYFTAEGRIDFRNLVKDLAATFKTRIELRQIGVRDEAKRLGGIGPCGRLLCCSTFLADFEPVSIKMAKDQNLSLNPAKISGLCGRLMCCLKYENDDYETAKRELPDIGEDVRTPYGEGRVTGLNILDRVIHIKLLEEEREIEYTLDEMIEEGIITAQATE